MKRFAVTSVAAVALMAAVSSFGQSNVYSRNAVGAIRVDIPTSNKMVLCGFNFKPIGSNEISLVSLLGTNLVGHAVATRATRVHLWNPASNAYLSVFFNGGTFYTVVGSIATNPMVTPGQGFWVQAPANATTNNTIFMMGEVISSNIVDQEVSSGFSLIANPYSAPLDLNDTNLHWVASGATASNIATRSDTVYVWNGSGYDGYWLKNSDSNWHYVIGGSLATNAIIPVGQGAWYKSRKLFTNAVVRPYPWW